MLISAVIVAVTLQARPAPPAPAAQPKPFDCAAPEYRQFDFWVGEWDVRPTNPPAAAPGASSTPRKPASNVIQLAHNGCVVIENWDDGIGGTGQSFNLYDRVSQQWHQTWVDSNGGLHKYWGGVKDGNMVLVGEVPLPPAARVQGRRTLRVTFIPMGPDKMRQFSESLNSDGTWTANYDLTYTRRAK